MSHSFSVEQMSGEEAARLIDDAASKNACSEAKKGFALTDAQVMKLYLWLNEQHKVRVPMDGYLNFEFKPWSMGLCVHVKNVLTDASIDLTEY